MVLRKVYLFVIKSLLCIIVFLVLGIVCKKDIDYKNYVYKKVYQEHMDFSSAKSFYNKYLGGIFPIEDVFSATSKAVFNEELVYQGVSPYEEGAVLIVSYNYLVPAVSKGIVVYIGEKEKYGNVVIVEGDDDIDIWYGNLCNTMVNIYDVIDKGTYLGEACDNKIYIVYTKKNEVLDYRDYLG